MRISSNYKSQIVGGIAGLASLATIVVWIVQLTPFAPETWDGMLWWIGGYSAYAVLTWMGILDSKKEHVGVRDASALGWVIIFFVTLLFSGFFLWIDCGYTLPVFTPAIVCQGHPGFSVIFTVVSVSLCVIALPSAVRAFVIERCGR